MSECTATGYPSIDKPWLKYYDEEFLAQPIPHLSIYNYLKERSRGRENLTALTYFGRKISFQELLEHIDEAAAALVSIGAKAGQRVLLLMPNIPETSYLLYACAKLGLEADFIAPRPESADLNASAKKILEMIKAEHIEHIVSFDLCYLALIKPIEKELLGLGISTVLTVSAEDSMTMRSKLMYIRAMRYLRGSKGLKNALKKQSIAKRKIREASEASALSLIRYTDAVKTHKSSSCKAADAAPGSIAVIVHTSGTTGAGPKPIPLTHDNMNFYVHQTDGANMPMAEGDRALHMLPYFAAFGVVGVLHAGLCHGCNLIEIPEFTPSEMAKLIKLYKPQTVIGAPSWFANLPEEKCLKNLDLSFLRMLTFGGDSMEQTDISRINTFLQEHNSSCFLSTGHGMSETCGGASYAAESLCRTSSVGIPMPLTTYAVIDPATRELIRFDDGKSYIEGELAISSGAVTPGMLDRKEIVSKLEYNGEKFILTRDIARMDRNGAIMFLSRRDPSFTRYDGYKVKPYVIENLIKTSPKVDSCIISPYYDKEKNGNMILATIVLNGREVGDRGALRKYAEEIVRTCFFDNTSAATRQIPSKIRFVDALPITANGKTDYKTIADNGLNGDEISVEFEESNISFGKVTIK